MVLAGPLDPTMLQESARYLMIATGMTLVISTAGIDLSVGSVMAVAGAAAMQTLSNGMNVWLSILIALAVGLAIGCVNGALRFLPGPTAVHHHPDYDARRPWYGQGHHLR